MGHPSHHAADASRVPQSGELGFAARPLCAPNHVHAPLFPFERTEQWMVLLVDVKANKLVGYQKLSQNSRFETVNLKFLAPKEAPPVSFLTRAPPCLYLLSLLIPSFSPRLAPAQLLSRAAHPHSPHPSRPPSPLPKPIFPPSIPLLFSSRSDTLRRRPQGTVVYEIHCLCSGYLGCDKKVPMKKTIKKRIDDDAKPKTAAEAAEDEDDEAEEDEEEPEGQWYYLGGNSVGEVARPRCIRPRHYHRTRHAVGGRR